MLKLNYRNQAKRHELLEKPESRVDVSPLEKLIRTSRSTNMQLALPLIALMLVTDLATAACTYIQNSYTGVVPANSHLVVQGPFTITGANGCSHANISSTISASGAGSAPDLFIERLDGATWTRVDGGRRSNASTLGRLGTYRVVHDNKTTVAKGYSGTTRYGR